MARTEFDLTALLRAIGVKQSEGKFDLVDLIQPTIQVGDLSAMGPAILPPSSVTGGSEVGVAANNTIFQITSQARGGSIVQAFVHQATNALIHYAVRTPLALTGPQTLLDFPTAHQSASYLAQSGQNVAGIGTTAVIPHRVSGDIPPLYVPRGLALVAQAGTIATSLFFSAIVQDVPVDTPADALTASLP